MFKFLPGILLIQLITVGLTLMAVVWPQDVQLLSIVTLFALVIAILASFWFSSIGRNLYHELLSRIREDHVREKEQIIIEAEREKAEIVNQSHRMREKEIRRVYARANFKVGAVVALGASIGTVLLFSQLVTFGLTLLVASGSGLLGYLVRVRQERLSREPARIDVENRVGESDAPKLLQSKGSG